MGSRHGKPVVYRVAAGKMADEGYEFFLSVNGVWLVKAVPDYVEENVSTKVVNLIQSYTGVVDRVVWRKH